MLQILVEQGVPAKIGAPIAKIGEGGEQVQEAPPAKPAPPSKQQAQAKPKEPEAPPAMAEEQEPAPTREGTSAAPPPAREQGGQDGQDDGGIKASPLAKRLAAEMGVDLSSLKGSGPEGRIVKEDVMAAGTTRPTSDRRRQQPAATRAGGPDVEVIEPSRMQATIARRMAEAKSTVPEFQVTVEARVGVAVEVLVGVGM